MNSRWWYIYLYKISQVVFRMALLSMTIFISMLSIFKDLTTFILWLWVCVRYGTCMGCLSSSEGLQIPRSWSYRQLGELTSMMLYEQQQAF